MANANNLSSSAQRRRSWRINQQRRVHDCLYDLSDELKQTKVDASGFALMWIGVGLQIAASIVDEMAAEMLCEDIVNESSSTA
jgi:hypothetical protein